MEGHLEPEAMNEPADQLEPRAALDAHSDLHTRAHALEITTDQ